MSYANNKDANQPAHRRSLISAFVIRCLDSIMSLVSVTKISSLMLASVAEQASLSATWSETPEDTFSHDEAHILIHSTRSSVFDWTYHRNQKNGTPKIFAIIRTSRFYYTVCIQKVQMG